MKTINVMYTCAGCGLVDRAVAVPQREVDNVVHWVEHIVMPRLMHDHRTISPACQPKEFQNIKIPIDEGKRLGEA